MNQITVGKFICKKRKEKNITQEQLAERIGVSNKTVSKWETGKCMPDYSVVRNLCDELEITVAELVNGAGTDENSTQSYDSEQIIDLLRRTQELENQKNMLYGFILVVMGIATLALSHTIGDESNFRDFLSGFLLGMSVAVMIVGMFIIGKSFRKK